MMVNYETDARYGLVENKLQSKFDKESNIFVNPIRDKTVSFSLLLIVFRLSMNLPLFRLSYELYMNFQYECN
jgi:hypothetical protein